MSCINNVMARERNRAACQSCHLKTTLRRLLVADLTALQRMLGVWEWHGLLVSGSGCSNRPRLQRAGLSDNPHFSAGYIRCRRQPEMPEVVSFKVAALRRPFEARDDTTLRMKIVAWLCLDWTKAFELNLGKTARSRTSPTSCRRIHLRTLSKP